MKLREGGLVGSDIEVGLVIVEGALTTKISAINLTILVVIKTIATLGDNRRVINERCYRCAAHNKESEVFVHWALRGRSDGGKCSQTV
jgi:hypothetical protein